MALCVDSGPEIRTQKAKVLCTTYYYYYYYYYN